MVVTPNIWPEAITYHTLYNKYDKNFVKISLFVYFILFYLFWCYEQVHDDGNWEVLMPSLSSFMYTSRISGETAVVA